MSDSRNAVSAYYQMMGKNDLGQEDKTIPKSVGVTEMVSELDPAIEAYYKMMGKDSELIESADKKAETNSKKTVSLREDEEDYMSMLVNKLNKKG